MGFLSIVAQKITIYSPNTQSVQPLKVLKLSIITLEAVNYHFSYDVEYSVIGKIQPPVLVRTVAKLGPIQNWRARASELWEGLLSRRYIKSY